MKDGRTTFRGNFKHELLDMMFLTISAAICKQTSWVEVEEFGKGQIEWLRKFFPFTNGIPSHDTLGRVFSKVDSESFSQCFMEWVESVSDRSQGVIAVDGKRLRGSHDRQKGRSALHMVSAYAVRECITLGQVATQQKSNEITAIPKLLDMLAIKGCTITIDAMGCQTGISRKIIDKKADYILGVKTNQEGLFRQIEKVFKVTEPESVNSESTLDHGRFEKRTCSVISNLTFFDDYKDWPGLKTLIKVESVRQTQSERPLEKQTRYYISSKSALAATFNKEIRAHWSIENKLHWVLDVNFKEDKSRRRTKNSAFSFNLIAKIALGLIEKNQVNKPKSRKMTMAAFDTKFREQVLGV